MVDQTRYLFATEPNNRALPMLIIDEAQNLPDDLLQETTLALKGEALKK